MWSEDRMHLAFVARLVFAAFGRYDYWIGLDNRDGQPLWHNRYDGSIVYFTI